MSSAFALPDWAAHSSSGPPMVKFSPDLAAKGLTRDKVLNFPAFKNWITTLKSSLDRQTNSDHTFNDCPYYLRSINIQSVDDFGKGILFMKLFAEVTNDRKESLPGVVFLRGGSVAILMIVRPSDSPDERYVIMTEQARIAAGSLSFKEIPAGMLDENQTFSGQAAREIKEEAGIIVTADELKDMTALATKVNPTKEDIMYAMYPSPGACDEWISIFLWEQEMDRLQIENLRDSLTGDRAASEKITVKLEPYEKLLEAGARDGKTLAAWSLYEYLRRVHPDLLADGTEDEIF